MENLETKKISSTFILSFKIRKQIKIIKNKFENFLMNYPDKFKIAPYYAEIKGLLDINKLKLNYEKLLDHPKIFNTFCGIAKNKDSNNSDILDAADYMGIVSASVPNLLMMSNHSISKTNIGGAAVEYEFYFNEFVKTGTCIKLLSGLRNIKNKTYTWSHWLIDISKEKILAEANAVIVTMDLKKRKSVQIPNKMKVALEKIILE
jgi:acyl-CoA thioesterase FadM